jgi:hypothetical protein
VALWNESPPRGEFSLWAESALDRSLPAYVTRYSRTLGPAILVRDGACVVVVPRDGGPDGGPGALGGAYVMNEEIPGTPSGFTLQPLRGTDELLSRAQSRPNATVGPGTRLHVDS